MTANPAAQKLFLPERLGIAADLTFGVADSLGYIVDCLLVHGEVVVPLNAMTLSELEDTFGTDQLITLLRERRLRFCPSYSMAYANKNKPEDFNRDVFFNDVRDKEVFREHLDRNLLFKEIEETFLTPENSDYSAWLPAMEQVDDSFDRFAGHSRYNRFYPAGEPRYYRTGAIFGVARMNDLLAVGVPAMEMDDELPQLLELCFPTLNNNIFDEDSFYLNAQKVISDLHKISGLPSFERPGRKPIHRTGEEVSQIIKAILSDEAHDLRKWLASNISSDLDVRSAYDNAEKLLPSKKTWTNWFRFGASTGFGTAIGALIADPLIGFAAGTAIGAADLLMGEKAASLALDSYHPKIWLSHMQRQSLLNGASKNE